MSYTGRELRSVPSTYQCSVKIAASEYVLISLKLDFGHCHKDLSQGIPMNSADLHTWTRWALLDR